MCVYTYIISYICMKLDFLADKMAQLVKTLTIPKSDRQISIPRTHMVRGENHSHELSSETHTYTHMGTHTYTKIDAK